MNGCERIVAYLRDRGTGTTSDLCSALGVHERTVRTHIASLTNAGAITSTNKGTLKIYRLADAADERPVAVEAPLAESDRLSDLEELLTIERQIHELQERSREILRRLNGG